MSHTRTMCILTLLAAQADFEMMLQPDGWSLTGILRRLGPNMDRDTANVVHKILFLKQHICLEPDENERAVVEQTPRVLEEQLIVTFEHLLAENARGASDSNPEEDAESSLHVRRVLERLRWCGDALEPELTAAKTTAAMDCYGRGVPIDL